MKGATVKIGGKATAVSYSSESEISAHTPGHAAGAEEVVVSDEAGTSSAGPKFTFVAPPTPKVTEVSPATGSVAGGTTGRSRAPISSKARR